MITKLCHSFQAGLDNGNGPMRVHLIRCKRSNTLTEAYHHPRSLRYVENLATYHLQNAVVRERLLPLQPRQALFVRKELSKVSAVVWFGIALLLTIGCGVCAGMLGHDLGLGLAVAGGSLSVLVAAQGLLITFARL